MPWPQPSTPELEELIPQDGAAAKALDIAGVFGATEDDAAKLRIISLVEVDVDALEAPPGMTADTFFALFCKHVAVVEAGYSGTILASSVQP